MLPKLELIVEGQTQLYVPSQSLASRSPETFPVFFNPAAKTNRSISVAVAAATSPRTYLDALAGTGARGVRVAKESARDIAVTLVDFNTASLDVARKNVRSNGLRGACRAIHAEANRFLTSRFEREEKFDAIDVDPFGSPAPFAQAALVAAAEGSVVSMTATDTAVLCGVYPGVSLRRYGARCVRSDFVHETGLRVLLGFAARMGAINDIGIEPIAAHSTLHYLRVFFRVHRGAADADRSIANLGFVTQCNACGERLRTSLPQERCGRCGERTHASGPLWTGSVVDEKVASAASVFAERAGWKDATGVLRALRDINRYPPFSFSQERVCSRLKIPSVPNSSAMESLSRSGFLACRSPFEHVGIKTDAPYEEFVSALRTASRTPT